jgi:hypothetical protein
MGEAVVVYSNPHESLAVLAEQTTNVGLVRVIGGHQVIALASLLSTAGRR